MKKLIIPIALLLSFGLSYAQQGSAGFALKQIKINELQDNSLLNKVEQINQLPDITNVVVVKVEDFEAKIRNQQVFFDLPVKGVGITATQQLDYRSPSELRWRGTFKNGSVTLSKKQDRLYGQIRTKGKVYDIQHYDDDHALLIEYNMDKLILDGCAVKGPVEAEIKENPEEGKISDTEPKQQSNKSGTEDIRALVLFTNNAQNTGLNMADLANTAEDQWFDAIFNSNIFNARLHIVDVLPSTFVENSHGTFGNISDDIEALPNHAQSQQLRDQFEADIVILLTNGNYPGIGGVVAAIGPNNSNAYAMVQVGSATSTMTLIHEAGHLFGARHQIAADPSPGDAHGYDWQKTTGIWPFQTTTKYGSVMRTQEQGRERVLHFSNPQVSHQGQSTGALGTAFNTRVHNTNGPTVAGFRFTQPDLLATIYGPDAADGGTILNFTSLVQNATGNVSYKWDVSVGGAYFQVSTASSLAYTMPNGNDLDVRLRVIDGDNEQYTDHHFVLNPDEGDIISPCDPHCADSTLFDTNGFSIDESLIYPNPSSDIVEIHLTKEDQSEIEKIEVIDLKGGLVFKQKITGRSSNRITLDVSSLKAGNYIIRLSGRGGSTNYRFIKE
ncbi:MAG: zinc-dependent metalloprotease [Ekhidna sp.]|uniref:zinc-dependent metalloprotease n=1 Tax=Ekhidna sp. TaxID=2608089 RepID=UPI0032EF5000